MCASASSSPSEELYLDAASTQAAFPSVIKAMLPFWLSDYANPASVHAFGKAAAESLERARSCFASDVGAVAQDVIFTSGGTESDNLAIKGIAMALLTQESQGDAFHSDVPQHYPIHNSGRATRNRIAISAVEHPAISESAEWMAQYFGFHIDVLPVDEFGCIDIDAAKTLITERTALVSVTLANNEVGTIQPVARIAAMAHSAGAFMHTDAVQAVGHIPVDMAALGVDAMSISGHKFGTPKGLGALILRSTTPFEPLISGGGQEQGRRSGTQNVAGAVGMAVALHTALEHRQSLNAELADSRDKLIAAIQEAIPQVRLTGSPDAERRLPGHASFVFPGVWGEALLVDLDAAGIMCSSGSACSDGSNAAPHTLLAMGFDEQTAKTSIRMTFQKPLAANQITTIVRTLKASYEKLHG
ncbi:MAG: cysteine desulfurase family protein [Bifidobacterium aquikefiri]|uniref:cysteine desulfurase n=1 Tax=Bifidobacterium aquikefiri TaxID=1653207 RepID=A0A261G537_9BIFI|nr:cysteine desulfurase family protein [Bifidobacterium aquikefiri]OZG66116.1 cysteine desulfurase [Bifidobacterium aquikefiri]